MHQKDRKVVSKMIRQSGVRLYENALVQNFDISFYNGQPVIVLRILDKNL